MMNHMLHEFHASVTMQTWPDTRRQKLPTSLPCLPRALVFVFFSRKPRSKGTSKRILYKERRSNIGKINYEPGRQGMSYLYVQLCCDWSDDTRIAENEHSFLYAMNRSSVLRSESPAALARWSEMERGRRRGGRRGRRQEAIFRQSVKRDQHLEALGSLLARSVSCKRGLSPLGIRTGSKRFSKK